MLVITGGLDLRGPNVTRTFSGHVGGETLEVDFSMMGKITLYGRNYCIIPFGTIIISISIKLRLIVQSCTITLTSMKLR